MCVCVCVCTYTPWVYGLVQLSLWPDLSERGSRVKGPADTRGLAALRGGDPRLTGKSLVASCERGEARLQWC